MSVDPVKKEKEDSIEHVKKYTSKLIRIKGSREYYSWFDERLISINGLLGEYPYFIEEFDKLVKKKLGNIPKPFVQQIISIFNYFSRFYHVKTIYETCETGILSPYFVNSLQFNVMIRFFNFINTDSSKFLIPPPYDLQFDENEDGSGYTEDPTYSSLIRQITNDVLSKPEYQMVFLTIKIYYLDYSHQNLIYFNKTTNEIYIIEPTLEMELKPEQTQGRDIDTFNPVITSYIRSNFPNFTFKGFLRPHACGLPYHGGLCAPLSITLVLRPDIQTYNDLIILVKTFMDSVIQEISGFHALMQHGIQNPTQVARYPAPSTFTHDFQGAYSDSDSDSEGGSGSYSESGGGSGWYSESESGSGSNSFGKNKSEIKYLKKLLCKQFF